MKKTHLTVRNRLAFMLAALTLMTFSCKKSPSTVGNNLIDENSFISTFHTDTTMIVAYSFLDTVNTKNTSYALLGSMNDPVFGTTQAGFYTQLHISSLTYSFGETVELDSLVLQLNYGGYYGDTTTLQTVHVYEMTDTLSSQESYYSYMDMPIGTLDHANAYQFYPRPLTKVLTIGDDTITNPKPVIRIPLSQELGNTLLHLDSTAYAEPDLFKIDFPGLYVTCETVSESGSVSYINLTNNTYSLLQLYYHKSSEPTKVMRYDYYITKSEVFYNRYHHDYTQGEAGFQNQVLEGDTELGQQSLFLQTMGGVKTKLLFQNFTDWGDQCLLDGEHIVINDAKLIIPASGLVEEDTTVFTAPSQLALIGLNEDGSTYLLPDFTKSRYGGKFSQADQAIVFHIPQYMQDVVRGVKPNLGVYMTINGASYNACRWVVAGPEAEQENRMRLEVTYSIIAE